MPISKEDLEREIDFDEHRTFVVAQLETAGATPFSLLAFLVRYAHWNGFFGSGVAGLASKVGRSRGLFIDPEARIPALGDRGVWIAHYIFEAARDEFDDSGTPQKDTHRCLAQATVEGLHDYVLPQLSIMDLGMRKMWDVPLWLQGLCDRVSQGYGNGTPDDYPSIFRAMGYHMGSEVLAAQEFTEIDRYLRTNHEDLVKDMLARKVIINGLEHPAYYWIAVHSDLGSGVESLHFEDSMRAVRYAFRFVDFNLHEALYRQVMMGFHDFARDHKEFFQMVNRIGQSGL